MKKILIVDDDRDIQLFLCEFFKLQGFFCVSVQNGRDAMARIKQELFDLVLTDQNMPVMGGIELISKLKNNQDKWPTIPIIMMTGNANPSSRYRAKQAGAIGILHKPFDTSKLLTMVSHALRLNASSRHTENSPRGKQTGAMPSSI